MTVYLDTSALVKLVVIEKESRALRHFLRQAPDQCASALVRTELLRAVQRGGRAAFDEVRRVLQHVHLIQVSDAVLDAAGRLEPRTLRSLDAIHLATAARLAPTLTALVTYDHRMADGAAALGLAVVAPA